MNEDLCQRRSGFPAESRALNLLAMRGLHPRYDAYDDLVKIIIN